MWELACPVSPPPAWNSGLKDEGELLCHLLFGVKDYTPKGGGATIRTMLKFRCGKLCTRYVRQAWMPPPYCHDTETPHFEYPVIHVAI